MDTQKQKAALQSRLNSVGLSSPQLMKYLRRIGQWSAAVTVMFLVSSITHRLEADPSADFSFSLSEQNDLSRYRFMSNAHVEAILKDHLDLFPRSQVPALAQHLLELCRSYRFDPNLILAVIRVESAFKVKATSNVGAMGLMQLMPGTAGYVAKRYGVRYTGSRSLYDPFTNLSIGVAYLSYLRDKYRTVSPYFQFAAYNMGPGRLDMLRQSQGTRFKGTKTKDYYEAIRRGIPMFRSYAGRSGLRHGV